MTFISEFFDGIAQITVWVRINIFFIDSILVPLYSIPGIDTPPSNLSKNLASELSWAKMEVSHTLLTWDRGGGGVFSVRFGSLIFCFLAKSRGNLEFELLWYASSMICVKLCQALYMYLIMTERLQEKSFNFNKKFLLYFTQIINTAQRMHCMYVSFVHAVEKYILKKLSLCFRMSVYERS